jgi:hypothetical protein
MFSSPESDRRDVPGITYSAARWPQESRRLISSPTVHDQVQPLSGRVEQFGMPLRRTLRVRRVDPPGDPSADERVAGGELSLCPVFRTTDTRHSDNGASGESQEARSGTISTFLRRWPSPRRGSTFLNASWCVAVHAVLPRAQRRARARYSCIQNDAGVLRDAPSDVSLSAHGTPTPAQAHSRPATINDL